MKLTPKNYIDRSKSRIKLKDLVVLCPLDWLVVDLTDKKPEYWKANKSKVYREKNYDIVNCLPGSMAIATLDEIRECGGKKVIFIGVGGGLKNQPSGTLLKNPNSISVINPYSEHEMWEKIKDYEVIDMESSWLKEIDIDLDIYLIVADRVYENEWIPLTIDDKYKSKYEEIIKELKIIILNN